MNMSTKQNIHTRARARACTHAHTQMTQTQQRHHARARTHTHTHTHILTHTHARALTHAHIVTQEMQSRGQQKSYSVVATNGMLHPLTPFLATRLAQ